MSLLSYRCPKRFTDNSDYDTTVITSYTYLIGFFIGIGILCVRTLHFSASLSSHHRQTFQQSRSFHLMISLPLSTYELFSKDRPFLHLSFKIYSPYPTVLNILLIPNRRLRKKIEEVIFDQTENDEHWNIHYGIYH